MAGPATGHFHGPYPMQARQTQRHERRWREAAGLLIGVLIVLTAALTVGREWVRLAHGGETRFAEVAGGYQPVREKLGPVGRVGFVCAPWPGDRADLHYYMAQSVLAPVLVVRGDDEPVVLAVFDTEEELERLIAAGSLRVRERVGGRLAILERRSP